MPFFYLLLVSTSKKNEMRRRGSWKMQNTIFSCLKHRIGNAGNGHLIDINRWTKLFFVDDCTIDPPIEKYFILGNWQGIKYHLLILIELVFLCFSIIERKVLNDISQFSRGQNGRPQTHRTMVGISRLVIYS